MVSNNSPILATPHTRGSTLQKKLALYCKPGYPAYAGIDPAF
jgi:hypothetical protein